MLRQVVSLVEVALFASLLSVVATPARADVGAGALTITCDAETDFVGVRLHIVWNEDLDSFLAQNPSRSRMAKPAFTILLDSIGDSYKRTCKTKSRVVVTTIQHGQELSVTENGATVAQRHIDSMWFSLDFEHRLQSRKSRSWEECINDVYGSFNGKVRCGPVTSSVSTNPKEIEGKWK